MLLGSQPASYVDEEFIALNLYLRSRDRFVEFKVEEMLQSLEMLWNAVDRESNGTLLEFRIQISSSALGLRMK